MLVLVYINQFWMVNKLGTLENKERYYMILNGMAYLYTNQMDERIIMRNANKRKKGLYMYM